MCSLSDKIRDREITRLCHFTKSTKMLHILSSVNGIQANDFMEYDVLNRNDTNRFDGHEDYISTSIEYPNMWYLNRIKDSDPLFKDWVILCINPDIMLEKKTLFCETNAAFNRGSFLKSGIQGFEGMYNQRVCGNRRTDFYRQSTRLKSCPTNDQGEVMIYKQIPRHKIMYMIVPNIEAARIEKSRLKFCGIDNNLDIIICKELFTTDLSRMIANGIRPKEEKFEE